eukprot:scaffold102028_cov28-Tisochrysis_lutea.AAC.2
MRRPVGNSCSPSSTAVLYSGVLCTAGCSFHSCNESRLSPTAHRKCADEYSDGALEVPTRPPHPLMQLPAKASHAASAASRPASSSSS